ncbi:MAG TPA: alpha/beta hydrolase, partial [Anaerolineae bacterium]|nr:alpha/beta hydrolase [Anaerolineae bacterium]
MSKKWLILLIGVALLMAVYLYPGPHASFEELYARVEPSTVASLQAFRRAHPPRSVEVDGAPWEYVSLGDGPETILFLHGMTGAYDIWWQQLEALQEDYRLIAVTYPAI